MTKLDHDKRENRILDAAAALFIQYGFDKTTVSDIACQAAVSKDALLEGLIIRELRRDLDPKVIAHIMDMLAFSLVGMDEIMPRENMPPLEDVVEGIADLMERALIPEDGGNPEAGRTIIRQLADAGRQQFEALHQSHKE